MSIRIFRFQREDILSSLLSRISGGGSGIKRAPSYVAPDLATAIRRNIASNIRHKKGFPCRYMHDITTFCLPAGSFWFLHFGIETQDIFLIQDSFSDLEELPQAIQDQLFEELLDRDAQQQLTVDAAVINWSLELTVRLGNCFFKHNLIIFDDSMTNSFFWLLGSRLYALWNRSAGDCLLDAVLQATWGVFDRDNTLRRALADTLHHAGRSYVSFLIKTIFKIPFYIQLWQILDFTLGGGNTNVCKLLKSDTFPTNCNWKPTGREPYMLLDNRDDRFISYTCGLSPMWRVVLSLYTRSISLILSEVKL